MLCLVSPCVALCVCLSVSTRTHTHNTHTHTRTHSSFPSLQDIGARMMVMSYGTDTQQYLDCIEQGMRDMVSVASGKNF